MSRQNQTGNVTENWVKREIEELELRVKKPIPDRGVDFVILSDLNPAKMLKIQVKGRGKVQKNKKYRWFQIRTTKKQREDTVNDGRLLCEAWRKKVELVDCFIFVSEMYREFWIFESSDIEKLVLINRSKYGNRKDNKEGRQTEINLDLEHNGIALTEMFKNNLNNWGLIKEFFSF